MAIVETVWDGSISKLSSGAGTKSAGVYCGSQSDLSIPGYGTARANNPKYSGKWYFEVSVGGSPLDVGIGRNNLESASYISGTVNLLRNSHKLAGIAVDLDKLMVYAVTTSGSSEISMISATNWLVIPISPTFFDGGYGAVPMVSEPFMNTTPYATLRTVYSEFTIKPPPGFAPWDYPRQAYTIITPTKPYTNDVTVHHVESAVGASPDSSELVGFVADDKAKFQTNPLLVCNGTASISGTINSPMSLVSTNIYKAPIDLTKFSTFTSGGVS